MGESIQRIHGAGSAKRGCQRCGAGRRRGRRRGSGKVFGRGSGGGADGRAGGPGYCGCWSGGGSWEGGRGLRSRRQGARGGGGSGCSQQGLQVSGQGGGRQGGRSAARHGGCWRFSCRTRRNTSGSGEQWRRGCRKRRDWSGWGRWCSLPPCQEPRQQIGGAGRLSAETPLGRPATLCPPGGSTESPEPIRFRFAFSLRGLAAFFVEIGCCPSLKVRKYGRGCRFGSKLPSPHSVARSGAHQATMAAALLEDAVMAMGEACEAVREASQVEMAAVERPSVFSVRLGTSDEAAAIRV